MTCVCGCGARAVHWHHVIYAQHISKGLRKDRRNLVPMAFMSIESERAVEDIARELHLEHQRTGRSYFDWWKLSDGGRRLIKDDVRFVLGRVAASGQERDS